MSPVRKNTVRLLVEVFGVALKLGLTSFGGPIAHLGYFHEEYVRKRKWLDERSYVDLVALCQFLPGPASSQVGIGIGMMRGGILGGFAAFLGFTLPSVIVLIIFAFLLNGLNVNEAGWVHGLKIVAVVVVAQAIIGMARTLTPDLKRKALALGALIVSLLIPATFTQVGIIIISAIIGFLFFKHSDKQVDIAIPVPVSRTLALVCLTFFFGLLFLLPILRDVTASHTIALFDSFYRSGALVFGGGHVVLPLLEKEFVPQGWISKESFLAGYGAAQAVPGPLFTFAAYLGAVMNGWKGALLATGAIFLPAFLLVMGTLPFWDILRRNPKLKGAMLAVNGAVVGILIAAFYTPIWTSAIQSAKDFALGSILFSLLIIMKLPPWVIVLAGMTGGMIFSLF
ncbi:chromate efflux transporter [Bacillus salipaludis]|uniref:Chromate efflux transporter n=1 Tax=Bacillus salipaludis TaxID=2547811 RepID=A0A4R5VVL7_9BACI|nr:chromate efflux transporter [Bacillus salipaludis]MDQ6597523.1 chromate efflux transporter [Bacillus salipaludis]TDK63057.1 chromate efflux transporter [Bacillus salipaludis]